jgi:hypothetical protein
MKKSRFLPVLLAAAIIGIAGCDAGKSETTTTYSAPPIGGISERSGDDAYAIDKINVDPLPENSWYLVKRLNGITIMGDKWDCNISAANYKDQFQDLDKYADTAMAGLVMNYKLETSDLVWEEPVHTTVGGYDAVLYDYTLQEHLYVTGADSLPITNEKFEATSYKGRHFTGQAYFFFSDTDAFYMVFMCRTEDYAYSQPKWDQIVANVKIDENLKLDETTTINATTTILADY